MSCRGRVRCCRRWTWPRPARTRRSERISHGRPSSRTRSSSFWRSSTGRPLPSVATTSSTTTSAPDGNTGGDCAAEGRVPSVTRTAAVRPPRCVGRIATSCRRVAYEEASTASSERTRVVVRARRRARPCGGRLQRSARAISARSGPTPPLPRQESGGSPAEARKEEGGAPRVRLLASLRFECQKCRSRTPSVPGVFGRSGRKCLWTLGSSVTGLAPRFSRLRSLHDVTAPVFAPGHRPGPHAEPWW